MNKNIRNLACGVSSLALMFNIIATSAASAQSCGDMLDDIKAKADAFAEKSEETSDQVRKDHESATSSSYSKDYFEKLRDYNDKATEAYELINKAYDLTGYTQPFSSYDAVQKSLPKEVTVTMGNAVELAQAALDEDNTKLDLAELRCDQSTEDSALAAWLDQADDQTVTTWKNTKKTACQLVHVLADLQDKREKLNQIREEGYPLFYMHKKKKVKFSGKERTIQLKVDLRMQPEYPQEPYNEEAPNINGQPILLGQVENISLSYNSWYKFSDNNWTDLNLLAALISDTKSNDAICLKPDIRITSSVKARLCVAVKNIDSNANSIKVYVKARFHYNSDWKEVKLGDVTIPAPFGYLADLSDMKEKKMEDMKSKIADRVASLIPAVEEVREKAEKWQNSCS